MNGAAGTNDDDEVAMMGNAGFGISFGYDYYPDGGSRNMAGPVKLCSLSSLSTPHAVEATAKPERSEALRMEREDDEDLETPPPPVVRGGPLGNWSSIMSALVGAKQVAADGDDSSTENDDDDATASTAATECLSTSSSSVVSAGDYGDDSSRVVRFAPELTAVRQIPHFSQYTLAERTVTWMSRFELRACKRRCLQVVEEMNRIHIDLELELLVEHQDDAADVDALFEEELEARYAAADVHARGLEKYTAKRCGRHRTLRKSAHEAVMGLQKFQTQMNVSVPDLIADLYETTCVPAAEAAAEAGRRDAEEAGVTTSPSSPCPRRTLHKSKSA